MRRIYWDTMLYAYWFEDHPQFGSRVQHIHQTMTDRGDQLYSSLFVLGEVLVGPLKLRNTSGAAFVEKFFLSSSVSLLSFSPSAAHLFADLRAREGVKPLDALHLAVAATAGVDLFLTNDRRLHRLAVPGIQFIATLDTDLF